MEQCFYQASLKLATSVTSSLKANFTLSPYSEDELEQLYKSNIRPNDQKSMYKIDSNLIVARSNHLAIMKIIDNDIEDFYEIPINDQIVQILKVPSDPFNEKAGKIQIGGSANKKVQDYIFVLTADFNCLLFAHDTKQGIVCLSTGNISDVTGQKREPPYSVFLGSDGRYIGLMLYENIIKIIPLVKGQNGKLALSNAFNVRIKHPEAHQIIPLLDDEQNGHSAIAVFYQQQPNRTINPNNTYFQLKLKKYYLNILEKDIEPAQNEQQLDFENMHIIRVKELEFGGFIAFDPENIHCYKKRINSKIISKKLRKPMKVTSITAIDQYDPLTKRTKQGLQLMRYLFATECGDLYLLAFNLEYLHLVTSIGNINPHEATSFMMIEFLAQKLPSCTTLNYLDNGLFFYGSKLADSLTALLETENTGHKDYLYISIRKRYESLGCISDLAIREQQNIRGQQKDLVVVGGQGHNSHISVLRKGVSVKTLAATDKLPQIRDNGIFILASKILIHFVGVDYLYSFDIIHEEENINIQESTNDTNNLQLNLNEQVLDLQDTKIEEETISILITNQHLKVFKDDFKIIVYTLNLQNDSVRITHACIEESRILLSLSTNEILFFDLTSPKTDGQNNLQPQSKFQASHSITALALSEQHDLGYFTMNDAPFYTINALHLKAQKVLATRSIANYADANICENLQYQYSIRNRSQGDRMEIDQIGQNRTYTDQMMNQLSQHFPALCVRSMQLISVEEKDLIILGLQDGRVLQLNSSRDVLIRIIEQPEAFSPQLNLGFGLDLFQDNQTQVDIAEAFWNSYQNVIGQQECILHKLKSDDGPIIYVQSSKQAIYSLTRQTLQMHFINENDIKQARTMMIEDKCIFVYENTQNQIIFGQLDNFNSTQLKQIKFDKEVCKISLVPNENLMIALMEVPNYEYLDLNSPAVNQIALLDSSTMEMLELFSLQKEEIASCLYLFEKKPSSATLSIRNQSRYVAIGTAIIKTDEYLPSKGRLMIFEIDTRQRKLIIKHSFQTNGSVQSIAMLRDDKYLVLGVNNDLQLFSMQIKPQEIKLQLLQTLQVGTAIQQIFAVNNTVVVGDIMRALYTFDFKEQKQNKLLNESAHTNHSIWVNTMLPLSESNTMVFDKECNMFVFNKNLLPTNDHEKFKLNMVACMKIGEEATKAIFGSLAIQNDIRGQGVMSKSKKQRQKTYQNITRAQQKRQQNLGEDDSEQISTETQKVSKSKGTKELGKNAEQDCDEQRLAIDRDYLRQNVKQAFNEMICFRDAARVIYGTNLGSLGVVCEIPTKTFKILNLILKSMEKLEVNFYGKLPRINYKIAKTESLKQEPTNVIDGDYVESFLIMDQKQQSLVLQGINKDFGAEFIKEIRQVIEVLKDLH
eukprot:403373826